MAEVVGGFLVPHDPFMFMMPDAAPAVQRSAVLHAFGQVAQRIAELRATTAIIIGSDHYILFGPGCLPSMLIGIGDVDGPLERMPGLNRGTIENNQPLARHLFDEGRNEGFDWTVAKALTVDHAIAIPYQLCVKPNPGVKTIPIYLNSGVDPVISLPRAGALGTFIGRAVRGWSGDARVVLIGSGGLSHWVGSAQMGRVNPEFDRTLLAHFTSGDLGALTRLEDDYLLEMGGNGSLEIRNLVCAMAAIAPHRGRTIAYEAIPEWICGFGFAELYAP